MCCDAPSLQVMNEILSLLNSMSPYLLLGFLLAGVMHAFIPGTLYNRFLSKGGFRSVFYGALLGVPLPLCSCGVIPTAMSLRKDGASKGATTAFLIATPETGVDSIMATYSMLGLPWAILRPLAAFCNALFGGWLIDRFDRTRAADTAVISEADTTCSCSHCHEGHEGHSTGLMGKMKEALRFAYIEMLQDIGKWLVIGLVVAGIITVCVPDSFFAAFRESTHMSMLLVLCIAIPMYICATGSIPIAVALIMKGLTPGAALVLLMAGPACNMASILVINKVMGRRTLALYLFSIFAMAILWGHVVDHLLPAEWFSASMLPSACCGAEESSLLRTICTVVFCLLLLNAARLRFWPARKPAAATECEGCSESAAHILEFHIGGMNCNHCKANCEKALLAMPAIEAVDIDLMSGTCRATLAPGTDLAHLSETIAADLSALGFEAKF